jgi:SAM-dependent methyltransferase
MSTHARSAAYYDAIQTSRGKDYAREANTIHEIVESHSRSGGRVLLDVGCGTARHIGQLRQWYDCEGLDVDRAMLAIASSRLPDVPFHCQDMIGFNLDRRFDAVLCLFGTIGYVPNVRLLEQTIEGFYRHLKPGGVAIVEPWVRPDDWKDGHVDARFADEPDLKVARMSVSRRDGNASILHYNYMVAGRDGVRTFNEPHRLMLFTDDEYRRAFARARFTVDYDPQGLTGRGLYIGTRAV